MHADITRRRFLTGLCVLPAALLARASGNDTISDRARKIHFSSIVLDTHDDTPLRFFSKTYDLGKRNPEGHIDIPRMREGGLNAIFFSVYLFDEHVTGSSAVQKALDQIDAIHENVRKYGDDLALCRTADEIRRAHARGTIAVLIGIEGGQMIGNDLRVLRVFGDLGVRYITLAHTVNNEWADSSNDKPVYNGLTDFGKDVVREMNRRDILVDISHVSDKTFYDALEVSRSPLIASHSSCRAISNHPRNMTDQMIRDLAAKGGVIHIDYEKTFLDQAYREAYDRVVGNVFTGTGDIAKACGDDIDCYSRENLKMEARLTKEGKLPIVSWEKIIEHIDHVVKLVGPDHVGLGSDFDGASMPEGMEDCSKLPKITEALVGRGYSEDAIRKILGENLLRVMEQNERVCREMQVTEHESDHS
jgi:membrane dipeptidase